MTFSSSAKANRRRKCSWVQINHKQLSPPSSLSNRIRQAKTKQRGIKYCTNILKEVMHTKRVWIQTEQRSEYFGCHLSFLYFSLFLFLRTLNI